MNETDLLGEKKEKLGFLNIPTEIYNILLIDFMTCLLKDIIYKNKYNKILKACL